MSTHVASPGNRSHASDQPSPRVRSRIAGILRYLWGAIPTLLVMLGITAVAYFGHRYEWKLPKFSAMTVGTKPSTEEEFCEEHAVPEGFCIECNTKLAPKPKDYGWCQEHGISQCVYEHPELAQLSELPKVSEEDAQRMERAFTVKPRQANNSRCKLHERRMQFSSTEAVGKSGIEVAVVGQERVVETISASGNVTYRSGDVVHLASRVAGNVLRINKRLGEKVEQDDLLAVIDSTEVGKAKEALTQAIIRSRAERTSFEKLSQLPEGAVAATRVRAVKAALDVAELEVIAAEQVLANLGLTVDVGALANLNPEELTTKLRLLGLDGYSMGTGKDTKSSNLFPLRAPQSGILVELDAVPGEVIDSQTRLFVIANTARMTAVMQIPAEEAAYVQLGQKVEFRTDGNGQPKVGTVEWISPEMDQKTRTVQIRTDLDNADGRLRANAFGTAQIVLREEPKAVVVPKSAVQWEGDCNVVFVRTKDYFKEGSPKYFEVRKVVPGVTTPQGIEIIAGVVPGEVVAAKGSDVLRGELLKNNLGEGCGCVDHK